MSDVQDTIAAPKRRGRPPKPEVSVEPLGRTAALRLLKDIMLDRDFDQAMREGQYEYLFERYKAQMEETLAWEAQPPCPKCGARPNRHPISGIRVRSWDAATRTYIDGHRASCLTLAAKK